MTTARPFSTIDDVDRRWAHLLLAVILVAIALFGCSRSAAAQDPTTIGSITASAGTVLVPLANVPSAAVQIGGAWSGGAVFEFTVDGGVTWWPLYATNASDGSQAWKATANSVWFIANVGYTHARIRATTLDSGTLVVTATRGFGGQTFGAPIRVVDAGGTVRSVASGSSGELRTAPVGGLPLPACNPVTKPAGNCRP